jgi:hypothetical protein
VCESGSIREWFSLPVSDADAALLTGRQAWVGDRIETTVRCPFDGCGERADVDFSIADYLNYRRPSMPRGVEPHNGGFRYQGVNFRVPTLADEHAARESASPTRTLSERCIESTSADVLRKTERLLERIAPNLISELSLTCLGCGRQHTAIFDPRAFVLTEVCDQAQFLWDDVHLIASQYHWSRDEILSLDRSTRVQLAERVRGDRMAGL